MEGQDLDPESLDPESMLLIAILYASQPPPHIIYLSQLKIKVSGIIVPTCIILLFVCLFIYVGCTAWLAGS